MCCLLVACVGPRAGRSVTGVWAAPVHYEGLQDRLAQVRDARAALDALREEHRDRLRREAEQAQRNRQMQMMQKLEIMRKKKQEYLQVSRQSWEG